ncbi:ThuA domain-containing protein [Gynurincola endophyticus]|uniref:ThuA domain-containing protein n=1 Tax=Gynurincola endophyticus TaxID=2479004 RepID=UPI0018F78D69|nr:ThuA domain-containing protein [Gynurincola endophyticus]
MRFLLVIWTVSISLIACNSSATPDPVYPMEVLVFTKTAGFKHQSIPVAVNALIDMGFDNDFAVDTTSDASFFQTDSLNEYQVIVFLNTTGDVLDSVQQVAFQQYIRNGGGFVGVHAASDTEFDWEWYGNLVGGYFVSHPDVQPAQLVKAKVAHPAIDFLPDTLTRTDEWYDFKWISSAVQPLLYLNQQSYQGSKMDTAVHPIAWFHEFEGGRSFYTGLGHTEASYTRDTVFLRHLLNGILWAGKRE